MSKSNISTRQKIVDMALSMFNKRGIEYVGLRELAALLDMRVSNITYYFPTKDDLVLEIALMLRDKNSEVMVVNNDMDLAGFLAMMRQVFKNHVHFRCLLLSFVHVMEQNKLVSESYKKTQNKRNVTIRTNIEQLAASGFLKLRDKEDVEFLASSIALISRFWISEAAISSRQLSTEQQIDHYLNLIARLLLPYATAKGRKQVGGESER